MTTKNSRTTYRSVFKRFCFKSEIAGIRHLAYGQISWILIFLFITSYCIYQCGCNLNDYLSYKISTRTTEEYHTDLYFPSITFVPQYVFKKSDMENVADASPIVTYYYVNDLIEFERLMNEVRYCM